MIQNSCERLNHDWFSLVQSEAHARRRCPCLTWPGIGGTASTVVTALICMRIGLAQALPFLLIILLSAYISALIGLFIGIFSNGLMIGIVNIKIVMILFLAPPVFFYLIVPDNAAVFWISYILPSSATFYGIMDLFNRQFAKLWPALAALLAHAVLWSIVYKLVQMRRRP